MATDPLEEARFEAWIRGGELPCVAYESGECDGRIHFAHLKHRGMGGTVQPSIGNGVPMCAHHHLDVYHGHGRRTFETRFEVDLDAIAAWYAQRFDAPFAATESVPPSGAL